MKTDYTNLDDVALGSTLRLEVEQMKLILLKRKRPPNYTDYFPNWYLKVTLKKDEVALRGQRQYLISTGTSNKREARKIAKGLWVDIKAKAIRPKTYGSKTLNDAIDEYLWLKQTINSNDIRYLQYFREIFGYKPLGTISREDLSEIQKRLYKSNPVKPQTINRRFTPLIAVINMAVDFGWISHAPKYKKLVEAPPKERSPYTEEELFKIIKACNSTGNKHLIDPILFLRNTGLRKSEMVNLKKEDVVDGGTAVRLKNQKNGTLNQRIPLNVYAQKLVKKNINNPTEFVFAGRGREGGLADFKKAWTTVRKIAGVNKDIHTIRHTAITKVAEKVDNVFKLQQFSRHEDTRSLETYVHIMDKERRRITEHAGFGITFGITYNK